MNREARAGSGVQARARALCLLVLVFALCGACREGRAEESKALIPLAPGHLAGTEWKLALTDDTTNVPSRPRVTLQFDDDHASGMGPCNRYRFSFVHDGTKVTTGHVAATLKACAEPVMAAEHRYFRALEAVTHADIEMHRLVLTHDHVRLVYERMTDSAVARHAGTA